MANTVTAHYDSLLGPHYAWMMGDFEIAVSKVNQLLDDLTIASTDSDLAVDLGAGHGIQSVALARRGFQVLAIDTCQTLLNEMAEYAQTVTIRPIHDDLCHLRSHLSQQARVIVCMGDTLTHLTSLDHIKALITDIAESLAPEGFFITSFRDYVSTELQGTDRFIPVRSNPTTIFTCFLEYLPTQVVVHDILYRLTDDGWQMTKGSYNKLRLNPDLLIDIAEKAGLYLCHRSTDHGMLQLAFQLK